ncbi:pentatricopeptide repeat-containing protein At4g02750-like [Selaginella moellendorffii]|uniref:pentatricopeptide repeat-containing protein At4g02750-like n=1 Tax=Selaginella moellendorffii TaxID=88036 RepID=UPI000D1CECA7|nr:pentatricopeptide repeat-containing protein At4g02750-like [Selaginella moellendorffii]|eukprot:XP_024540719.1 pentatricopeptide repeat-containing protein At4g02750-like [Selaginella moellendorffii]
MVTAFHHKGDLDSAKELFDKMPERNPVSWGALMAAYAVHNRLEEVKRLFDAMEKSNVYVYTVMITAYAKAGEIANAERMFALMPEKDVIAQTTMLQAFAHNGLVEKLERIKPNEITFIAALGACADAGKLETGQAFHAKIIDQGPMHPGLAGEYVWEMP